MIEIKAGVTITLIVLFIASYFIEKKGMKMNYPVMIGTALVSYWILNLILWAITKYVLHR